MVQRCGSGWCRKLVAGGTKAMPIQSIIIGYFMYCDDARIPINKEYRE